MKSKLLSIVLAFVLVVSMTACSKETTTTTTTSTSEVAAEGSESSADDQAAAYDFFYTSEEQAQAWVEFEESLAGKYDGVTLNFVTVSDPWIESMMEQASKFEELTGATINFNTLGYDAAYSKEVLIGSQESAEADLFAYDIPWLGAFKDYMLPLDDYINENEVMMNYDDFFNVAQEASVWEGETLGVPFAPYFIMFTYNTEMFDGAGLDVPDNFDDLVAAAAALKTDTVAGIAMNNQAGTAVGQAYFEYIYNFGGKPFESLYPGSTDYYADMTPLFNSEESLAVVKMFKDLLASEGPGALNMAWNERFSTFATGNAAMMSPWVTDIAPLSDPEQSLVVDSYKTAPAITADGVDQHTPIGGWSIGVNKYSENQEAAMDFIGWVTAPATAYEFATTGGLPARYSIINDESLAASIEYYPTLQEVVDTAFPAFRPQITESFEIMDTVGTYIAKYLEGTMELEEAMTAANDEMKELMISAGYHVTE